LKGNKNNACIGVCLVEFYLTNIIIIILTLKSSVCWISKLITNGK